MCLWENRHAFWISCPNKRSVNIFTWYRNISMCVLLCSVAQLCPALCNPMNLLPPAMKTRQVPLSMGFSRQEYWPGLPFPSPGDCSHPGIKLTSPALAGSLSLSHLGSPMYRNIVHCKNFCNLLAAKNSTEDIFRMRWWEASDSHNLALLSLNYDKLLTLKAVLRHVNPLNSLKKWIWKR